MKFREKKRGSCCAKMLRVLCKYSQGYRILSTTRGSKGVLHGILKAFSHSLSKRKIKACLF